MAEEMGSGRVRVDTVDAQWVCWVSRCFMSCAPAESTTADRAGNRMKVERIVAPIRKMGTVEGKVRRGAGTWGWRVRGLRVYIIVSAFRDRSQVEYVGEAP